MQLSFNNLLALLMLGCGALTFVILMLGGTPAQYGRYSSKGRVPCVSAQFAWVTQEMWSALVPALAIMGTYQSGGSLSPAQLLLLGMFLAHYTWRSFAYPLLLRGGKPTPIHIWLMACFFCVYNGYMQAASALEKHADEHIGSRHMLGAMIWLIGWGINLHSDHILRNLRKPGETGYKIPKGGAFDGLDISGANYFGEIVEWAGFAIAAWSLPALAFAVFTFCNLAPRAWQHHQWYREKFNDYPEHRRAVLPCLW